MAIKENMFELSFWRKTVFSANGKGDVIGSGDINPMSIEKFSSPTQAYPARAYCLVEAMSSMISTDGRL